MPTSAGEALIGPARVAMRSLDLAAAAVENVRGLQTGRLDVVAHPTLASDPLAALVGRFRATHPGLHVRIGTPDSHSVSELVETGLYEIGLALGPVATGALGVLELPREEVLIAFGPGSSRQPGEIVDVHELESIPLVVDPRVHPKAVGLLAGHGVEPKISVETFHRDSIVPLVLGGAGAALVAPRMAEWAGRHGAIVCRLRPKLHRQPVLLYRRDDLTAAAKTFVRLVADGPR
ncbi:LysR family transcriptional regulator substrate-binding protein [Amycolatopsis sp. Poz14]|nr:LysR family transcriptional regulator substrate-binding protein [Amycolatopsis sp. Poz14]